MLVRCLTWMERRVAEVESLLLLTGVAAWTGLQAVALLMSG